VSGSRPSLFEDEGDDLGLERFAPTTAPTAPAIPPDVLLKASEESGFPSRASAKPKPATPAMPASPQLARYKSGRTVMLNARLTQRAHNRYHELVAAEQARFEAGEITHKPTLGEIVERALAALEREMAGKGTGVVQNGPILGNTGNR